MITPTHSTTDHHYFQCEFGGHPVRLRKSVTTQAVDVFVDDVAKALGYDDKDDFLFNDTHSLHTLIDLQNALNNLQWTQN